MSDSGKCWATVAIGYRYILRWDRLLSVSAALWVIEKESLEWGGMPLRQSSAVRLRHFVNKEFAFVAEDGRLHLTANAQVRFITLAALAALTKLGARAATAVPAFPSLPKAVDLSPKA